MTNSPQLSIIIPCYNIAPHIAQCIDSVLAQTYPHFELLLIDDGSTDDTLLICQKYAALDDRIKVDTHDNKGVSYTRNRGVGLATGEWIIFIDGDDYIKPDYIESLANNCEANIWPICGMINVQKGKETENENYHQLLELFPDRIIHKKDFLYLLKYHSYSSPCARMYDRSVIKEHGITFPENITYQEDLLFNLEYSQCMDQVKLVDYYGYYYIEHPTSSTGRYHHNFNHIDLLYRELKKYIQSEKDQEILQEFIFQTILRRITNVFHPDSPKNKKEKLQELKEIVRSDYYLFSIHSLKSININYLLKTILKSKSTRMVYYYYNLRKLHNQ